MRLIGVFVLEKIFDKGAINSKAICSLTRWKEQVWLYYRVVKTIALYLAVDNESQ